MQNTVDQQKEEIVFLTKSQATHRVLTKKGQVLTQTDYDNLRENLTELQKINAEQERQLKKLKNEKEKFKFQKEQMVTVKKEKQHIEVKLQQIYEHVKEFLPFLEKLDSNWSLSESGQTVNALKQTKKMLNQYLQQAQKGPLPQSSQNDVSQLIQICQDEKLLNKQLVDKNKNLRGTIDIYHDLLQELNSFLLQVQGSEQQLEKSQVDRLVGICLELQTKTRALHQSTSFNRLMQSPKSSNNFDY